MNTTADVFPHRPAQEPVTRSSRSRAELTLIRGRRRTAAVLTVLSIVSTIVLGLWLGKDILPIYLMPMPFGLFLLWAGADVLRADECEPAPQQ